jgi:hypothetical protein
MPVDYKKYPANWRELSREIRKVGRCELCDVRQYAVGYRQPDGEFYYERGNAYWDEFQYAVSYKKARAAADFVNESSNDGFKRIVIVLTVAHLCDCEPLCGARSHLKALCQRCHLRLDAKLHAKTRAARRDRKRELLQIESQSAVVPPTVML